MYNLMFRAVMLINGMLLMLVMMKIIWCCSVLFL